MRIVSIGEILWDVIGNSEYLGGAPLNFAAHASKLGHEVYLVSAVGEDERGQRALDRLSRWDISTEFVQVIPGKRTGTAEVDLDPAGKPLFRIVRPAAYDFVNLTPGLQKRIVELQPSWIYVGTLYHNSETALNATTKLFDAMPPVNRIYDVNLRDGNWNLTAVERLATRANVIKLSDTEAEFLDASLESESGGSSVRRFSERWSDQYNCRVVCVTLGERGCAIYECGDYMEVPGRRVEVADTVGAGDAFAAALIHGLDQGWNLHSCAKFANAVAGLVASRPGAIPDWSVEEVWPMLDR